MADILEMRRVFETVQEQTWNFVWVKNPYYNQKNAVEYEMQGVHYPYTEYIEKEIPKTIKRKRSHIEYRIECEYCKGTNSWVRRKDAKYCCNSCRNLAKKK